MSVKWLVFVFCLNNLSAYAACTCTHQTSANVACLTATSSLSVLFSRVTVVKETD